MAPEPHYFLPYQNGLAFASLPHFQTAVGLCSQEEDYTDDLSYPVDSWSEKDDPIILELLQGVPG